jgi:Holliday junction resolvase RusA-like endonuclease
LIENLEPVKDFPIEIELVIYSGYDWQSKNDIDNCIKPTIDLLVKANILPDDSTKYIKNVSIRHVWMKNTSKMVIYYHKIEE